MKISEIFSVLFPKVRKINGPKPSNVKQADSQLLKRPDEVKLAADAKFIASLRAEMNTRKDISREEKLAEIEKRLADGGYKVPINELARKILGD
jgi:anti-sigma28 factor (negative regulator of flagellin synthesis)